MCRGGWSLGTPLIPVADSWGHTDPVHVDMVLCKSLEPRLVSVYIAGQKQCVCF